MLFGLGLPEMAVIVVVAIFIFGPKKIPELGSALGKTLRGFKEELKNDDDENNYGDEQERKNTYK